MGFIEDCSFCKDVLVCLEGLKGENADESKLMIVLNQPDDRILQPVFPGFDAYEIALMETQTGKQLNKMLEYNELSLDDVYLVNAYKGILPKGDRQRNFEHSKIPRVNQYKTCIENQLDKQIKEFIPKGIVACGGYVFDAMFGDNIDFGFMATEGNTLRYKDVSTLIYPHPSRIWSMKNEKIRERYYVILKNFLQTTKL